MRFLRKRDETKEGLWQIAPDHFLWNWVACPFFYRKKAIEPQNTFHTNSILFLQKSVRLFIYIKHINRETAARACTRILSHSQGCCCSVAWRGDEHPLTSAQKAMLRSYRVHCCFFSFFALAKGAYSYIVVKENACLEESLTKTDLVFTLLYFLLSIYFLQRSQLWIFHMKHELEVLI